MARYLVYEESYNEGGPKENNLYMVLISEPSYQGSDNIVRQLGFNFKRRCNDVLLNLLSRRRTGQSQYPSVPSTCSIMPINGRGHIVRICALDAPSTHQTTTPSCIVILTYVSLHFIYISPGQPRHTNSRKHATIEVA